MRTKVKNAEKTLNMFLKVLIENGLDINKLSLTNPSITIGVTYDGNDTELTIHDNWINLSKGNSSVGSAIDRDYMVTLVNKLKNKEN